MKRRDVGEFYFSPSKTFQWQQKWLYFDQNFICHSKLFLIEQVKSLSNQKPEKKIDFQAFYRILQTSNEKAFLSILKKTTTKQNTSTLKTVGEIMQFPLLTQEDWQLVISQTLYARL